MDNQPGWFERNNADMGMVVFTCVSALNFIVVRDAVSQFDPITFNALRFMIGAWVMLPLLMARRSSMRFAPGDLGWFLRRSAFALVGTQVLFVSALQITTSTNTALLMATTPTWTAVFGVIVGKLNLRRGLVLGLGITLAGTSAVILARSNSDWSLSSSDMLGCLMVLCAAVISGWYTVVTKPFVDRYSNVNISIIKHLTITSGMVILALPNLVNLRPGDVPQDIVLNLFYGGLIATITGSVTSTFALRKIGPTRTTLYQNITPVVTAVLAFVLLGEMISLSLAVGGAMTLGGVWVVRHNLREARQSVPTPQAATVH